MSTFPSNSTSANSTEPPNAASSSSALGIVILSLALVVGLPGNLFIVWTILARMQKRTVTCILILHLAVADTAVLLTAPFFIHLLANGAWVFGGAACKICHYIGCLGMYASILLISFMSLDRFLVLYRPVLSQKMRTKVVVMGIIAVVWISAFLLAIPMPFYRAVVLYHGQLICIPLHSSFRHIIFQYLVETIFGFLLPFSVILSSYIYISRRLKSAKFQHKRKTAYLISLIVVAFAVFWLPYHIVNIIQALGNLTSGSVAMRLREAAKSARPNVTALAFLSSSVNPILYAFLGSSFIKSAGLEFMAKLFEGTASEDSGAIKASQAPSGEKNDPMEMERMNRDTDSKTFSSHQTE